MSQRPTPEAPAHVQVLRFVSLLAATYILGSWLATWRHSTSAAVAEGASDWVVFYRAAQRSVEGGWGSVYARSLGERYPFLYPPALLAALAPLARLTPRVAYGIISGASLPALALALLFLRGLAQRSGRADRLTPTLLILASAPWAVCLLVGQSCAAFLLAAVAALHLWRRGRSWPAGLVLSLTAVKPTLCLALSSSCDGSGRWPAPTRSACC